MIKFFRKIRQKALTNNKFSKYILYAIGEIVLVVIGILIALQLNSKKAKSDTFKKQQNYLALIKGEMKNNLLTLSNESEDLLSIIENNRKIIALMDSDSAATTINENDLSSLLLMPISRAISIDYENGAFKELISSGGLKDIHNDSIRTILRSWESKLITIKEQENALRQSLNKTIEYVEAHGNYRAVFDRIGLSEDLNINLSSKVTTNKHLLTSQKLENILLNYLACAIQLHEKNYPTFKNDIQSLIDMIDKELKK
ncbi:hypothetical protein [Aquimarina aggregata]|uniref:hypothetical protein n=1 Tax=Aquimarina aggregata TaxID=1642818 RepID=UPI002493A1E0|nr:hypothetical protein [Aquimarina aggregata]